MSKCTYIFFKIKMLTRGNFIKAIKVFPIKGDFIYRFSPCHLTKDRPKKRLICQLLHTLTSTPFTSLFEMYKITRAFKKWGQEGETWKITKIRSKKFRGYTRWSASRFPFLYDILTLYKMEFVISVFTAIYIIDMLQCLCLRVIHQKKVGLCTSYLDSATRARNSVSFQGLKAPALVRF